MIAMNPLMLRSIALGLLATTPLPFSYSQPVNPPVALNPAVQVTQPPARNDTTAGTAPLQRLAAAQTPAESTAPAKSPAAVTDPALDIVLVLDNSGSMKQNDPQLLTREVVTRFLDGISANTRMGMVVFDQDARLIEPLTALDSLNAKIGFLKGLDSLNYQGKYTNSPVAIERALYELRTHGREQADKIVIFLTDGIVDTGDSARDREKAQWLKDSLTVESQKLGIRLFTIAFTDRADYQLIQTLAMKTGGEYFRAYQAKEIEGVFNAINARLVPARPR
jgi:Mg-chelatase subunit ChlD